MLMKLFRPSGMALGIVIASLFLGTNVLAKDWGHHKHYKSHATKHERHKVKYTEIMERLREARSERPSLKALQEQIAAFKGNVDNLTDVVDAQRVELQNQINDLTSELASVRSITEELQSQVNENMGDVGSLKTLLEEYKAAADRLEGDLHALEDRVDALDDNKQDAIKGCPSGMAMQDVLSDGTAVCVSVGGSAGGGGQLDHAVGVYPAQVGIGSQRVTATCPPDYEVISGGYVLPLTQPGTLSVTGSYSRSSNTWTVEVMNLSAPDLTITAEAYCARIL